MAAAVCKSSACEHAGPASLQQAPLVEPAPLSLPAASTHKQHHKTHTCTPQYSGELTLLLSAFIYSAISDSCEAEYTKQWCSPTEWDQQQRKNKHLLLVPNASGQGAHECVSEHAASPALTVWRDVLSPPCSFMTHSLLQHARHEQGKGLPWCLVKRFTHKLEQH